MYTPAGARNLPCARSAALKYPVIPKVSTVTAVRRVQSTASRGSSSPGARTPTAQGAPQTNSPPAHASAPDSRGRVSATRVRTGSCTWPPAARRVSARLNAGTSSSAMPSSISRVAAISGTVHAIRKASLA